LLYRYMLLILLFFFLFVSKYSCAIHKIFLEQNGLITNKNILMKEGLLYCKVCFKEERIISFSISLNPDLIFLYDPNLDSLNQIISEPDPQ
jgi:hypothetical protein